MDNSFFSTYFTTATAIWIAWVEKEASLAGEKEEEVGRGLLDIEEKAGGEVVLV